MECGNTKSHVQPKYTLGHCRITSKYKMLSRDPYFYVANFYMVYAEKQKDKKIVKRK